MSSGGGRGKMGSIKSGRSLAGSVDLLMEIFIRLPVKSVCKFWHFLISNDADSYNRSRRLELRTLYVRRTHSLAITQFAVSFSDGGRPTRMPPVPYLDSTDFSILDSCNGLLLCQTRNHYVVCNPTTQSHALVPFPSPLFYLDGGLTPYLAFDPSKSRFFKLIRIVAFVGHSLFQIYSSESGSWNDVKVGVDTTCPTFMPSQLLRGGVLLNGGLHWLHDEKSLFRFDVDEEKSSKVCFPDSPCFDVNRVCYFGECRGKLLVVMCTGGDFRGLIKCNCDNVVTILEMDKEYSGWTEMAKFVLTARNHHGATTSELSIERNQAVVMCVTQVAEDENEYEVVLGYYGQVVSYNTKFKTSKVLPVVPDSTYFEGVPVNSYGYVYPLLECLSMV